MATASSPPRTATLPDRIYRISLDVYESMGALGLIHPADRVVLLDGMLVTKMTKGPRHTIVTQAALRAIEAVLPAGWHVRKEDPIAMPGGPEGDSAPEPDLAVVAGDFRAYRDRHPLPAQVGLIVEVADSSLAEDRKALHRYAWAGIPEVWIVNLVDETIEVSTGPSGPVADPGYAQRTIKGVGDVLTSALGDPAPIGPIAVVDLLA